MNLTWPLFALADERGCRLPYACIQSPARSKTEVETIQRLMSTVRLLGFTSYLRFPACYTFDDETDYESLCVAWCHCFREPQRYFRRNRPLLRLSYSDFTDFSLVWSERLFSDAKPEKIFDFAYVCQPGKWKEHIKNWDLAQRCIPMLCGNMKLTGIVVGREDIKDAYNYDGRLTTCGEVSWLDLMRIFSRSRFLFVPNELDPSPRIIAEALCLDVPVLVNRNILGGWSYINPFTGAFFEGVNDVALGAHQCLKISASPRKWFIANSGPLQAGRRLACFLAAIDPEMRDLRYVHITDSCNV